MINILLFILSVFSKIKDNKILRGGGRDGGLPQEYEEFFGRIIVLWF